MRTVNYYLNYYKGDDLENVACLKFTTRLFLYKKTIIFAWASIFLTFPEIEPEIFFKKILYLLFK